MARSDSKTPAAADAPLPPSADGAAEAASAPVPTSVPLKPRWDDTAMQSAYANVCNVSGTREEITLLFGTNKALQPGGGALEVALSHRIVLTPYTAKRLAQMLAQGVKEYEQRFGAIPLD